MADHKAMATKLHDNRNSEYRELYGTQRQILLLISVIIFVYAITQRKSSFFFYSSLYAHKCESLARCNMNTVVQREKRLRSRLR